MKSWVNPAIIFYVIVHTTAWILELGRGLGKGIARSRSLQRRGLKSFIFYPHLPISTVWPSVKLCSGGWALITKLPPAGPISLHRDWSELRVTWILNTGHGQQGFVCNVPTVPCRSLSNTSKLCWKSERRIVSIYIFPDEQFLWCRPSPPGAATSFLWIHYILHNIHTIRTGL